MIRMLNLSGDARNIGRQHGEQVTDLRPQILTSIQNRLTELRKGDPDFSQQLKDITRTWEKQAPETLEMLLGIAESLDLKWDEYFAYTIASYLTSCLNNRSQSEGCSTWAANGNITHNGAPILAKNRDYHTDHQPLQCLARIKPAHGHPFLCLTSAGSPGVFSSGINSTGLAVVDTFISSSDIGPGIARYSLMMDILQKFSMVKEAINYLPTNPHFGDGSVTVLDADGDMAVFEIAHSIQAVRRSDKGYIASTNHFTTQETRSFWMDKERVDLRGNSQGRLRMIEAALGSAMGQVDIPWSQALMSAHGDNLSAVCRHPEIDPESVTISCVILLPREASMYVANGQPCQTPFDFFRCES
jgi:isopenicillin-N N-acyltransferase like protein